MLIMTGSPIGTAPVKQWSGLMGSRRRPHHLIIILRPPLGVMTLIHLPIIHLRRLAIAATQVPTRQSFPRTTSLALPRAGLFCGYFCPANYLAFPRCCPMPVPPNLFLSKLQPLAPYLAQGADIDSGLLDVLQDALP